MPTWTLKLCFSFTASWMMHRFYNGFSCFVYVSAIMVLNKVDKMSKYCFIGWCLIPLEWPSVHDVITVHSSIVFPASRKTWVTWEKERRFSSRSAPSATLLRTEASTKWGQTFGVFLAVRLVRQMATPTRMPTRAKVLIQKVSRLRMFYDEMYCHVDASHLQASFGVRIPWWNIWKTPRSTFPAQRWSLLASRRRAREPTLLHIWNHPHRNVNGRGGNINLNVCSLDLQYLGLYSKRCDGSDRQRFHFMGCRYNMS